MTNRLKDLPRTEGPQGLTIPKMELLPLDNPTLGQTGVQYIFEDVYGAIDMVFTENTDPDNPEPLVVSSEGEPRVVLSKQSEIGSPPLPHRDSTVSHQYRLSASPGDVAFNLLTLKIETNSFASRDGRPFELSPHRYASADSDPWGLTRGFDINANHMTFFGPEYPSANQVKRFYDRSAAVLRLLGIVNPEVEQDIFDIPDMPDMPVRYR